MKAIITIISTIPLAVAHHAVTNLYVDGVDQGGATNLRHPAVSDKWNSPVTDLRSPDMACGLQGTTPVGRAASVSDGATLTFKYRQRPDNPNDYGSVDPSHKGPCSVYLKQVQDALQDGAAGDGWFKIWDMGSDGSQWCSDHLVNNGGYLTAQLPKGLAGGYYIVRTELAALHNTGSPQYYIDCAQIYIQSSGNLKPQDTVSIPGYATQSDQADSYNIYDPSLDHSQYVPPGPAPAKLVAAGSVNTAKMPEGQRPANCVLEVGNWCGIEVPDYHDSTSCWATSKACWASSDACWKSPGQDLWPSQFNCPIWEAKCSAIDAQCYGQGATGPSNKGKDLTPSKKNIMPPPPPGPTRGADGNQAPSQYAAPTQAATSSASAYNAPKPATTTVYYPPVAPNSNIYGGAPSSTQVPQQYRSTAPSSTTLAAAAGGGYGAQQATTSSAQGRRYGRPNHKPPPRRANAIPPSHSKAEGGEVPRYGRWFGA